MQLPLSNVPGKDVARFWSKVRISQPDECWEWTGSIRPSGHGGVKWPGQQLAHRVAYLLAYGESPAVVAHLCFNPACCNPAHLRGDDDNTPNRRDADRAKLTPADVDYIRRHYVKGTPGVANSGNSALLAIRFGVSRVSIINVVARRSWA